LRRSAGLLPLRPELQSPMAECPGCSAGCECAAVCTAYIGAADADATSRSFCDGDERASCERARSRHHVCEVT
jgi:hypothetical protein